MKNENEIRQLASHVLKVDTDIFTNFNKLYFGYYRLTSFFSFGTK